MALILFTSLTVFSEYLFFLLERHQHGEKRIVILDRVRITRIFIESVINTTLNLTLGLVVYVSANPDVTNNEFSKIAKEIMDKAPHIRNIALAKNNIISHIYIRK